MPQNLTIQDVKLRLHQLVSKHKNHSEPDKKLLGEILNEFNLVLDSLDPKSKSLKAELINILAYITVKEGKGAADFFQQLNHLLS